MISDISTSLVEFTPSVGSSSSLASRNFYVTDNAHTFIEIHFCLASLTLIGNGATVFFTLPSFASNARIQYGFACTGKTGNDAKFFTALNDGNNLEIWNSLSSSYSVGVEGISGYIRISLIS